MSYLSSLLAANEEIQFTTRPHWTFFAAEVWWRALLFLIAAVAAVAINLMAGDWATRLTGNQLLLLRAGAFVLLLAYPASTVAIRYIRWRGEQFVVTNLRVVQVAGILSKRVLDSSLDKVNDVMLRQGILGRLLNYGDLEILTASEQGINKFRRVARPIAFKTAMLDAKQRGDDGARDVRDVREDATKLLDDLARLRERGVLTDAEFETKKAKLLSQI